MFYVYTYTDPRNGEVFYVGLGKNRRWKDHLRLIKNGTHPNTHFANRVKILITEGRQPIIEKVMEDLDKDEASKLERDLIKEYGRRDLGTGSLVNWTDGGDGTRGWSAEQRAAQSNRRKGKISVIDSDGNRFTVEKTDPRWLSGELKGQNSGINPSSGKMKGYTMAKSKDGKILRVHKDDPRMIEGSLVGINKGIVINDVVRTKMSTSQIGIPKPKPEGFRETMRQIALNRNL